MGTRVYRKRGDDLNLDKPVEMPDDTKGKCKRCNKLAELGDGFCLQCWDKGSTKNKSYPKIHTSKRNKKPVGRPKTAHV